MPQDVIAKIQELLNEEKWTRATIENYTRKNFITLDGLIETAIKEDHARELRDLCLDHTKHSQNSIIALYVIGIINYEIKALDNNYLSKAITLFRDNKKWSIVEFLADRILGYEENRKALKALVSVYQNMNNEEDLWKVLERLVKVDHDNADIPRKIALHYQESNPALAIYYYKLTLRRLVLHGDPDEMREIWNKLVELIPGDLDFFFSLDSKLTERKLPAEAIGDYYYSLFLAPCTREAEINIAILQIVISHHPKHREARNALIAILRERYALHSRLESALLNSGVEHPAVPIQDALDAFNRHIAFDTGDAVSHRSWGIGRVTSNDGQICVIDFDNKKNHRMDLDMAGKSLAKLENDHLWLMSREKPDELKNMANEAPEDFLKLVLSSFGKEMLLKDMKQEIVRSKAMTESAWTAWWNRNRKIFKTNPAFGTSPERKNVYFLRKKPITLEEDSLARFESEKEFSKKLAIFSDLLSHAADFSTPTFQIMISYFVEKAASQKYDNEAAESVLFLSRCIKQITAHGASCGVPEPDIKLFYSGLEDPAHTLASLIDVENRRQLISIIRKNDAHWQDIYMRILRLPPAVYDVRVMDDLLAGDYGEEVYACFSSVITHYRENIDRVVWLAKLYFEREKREDALSLNLPDLIGAMLDILAIVNRDINNKSNVGVNRRRYNTLYDILFKENGLERFIEEESRETVAKIVGVLPVIADVVDETEFLRIASRLREVHPGLELSGKKQTESAREIHPFLVTQTGYSQKQAEYKNIVEVEIPANSKDISLAVEKGDLSENAEYKAALEHQEQLKARVSNLDEELKKARIVAAHDIVTDEIGFGCRVTLLNLDANASEILTILGEWESDPKSGIISYKSPLGRSMLFHKISDEFDFQLDSKKTRYRVLAIETAGVLLD
ncbi:MAG: transcription elongation factor GreA [Spirochaetota bacterium]|jgi:transcription elongation factor GreA|nr:transcription elongation factor GreA [Spirochaetota bacterium]